jgi:ribonucleoside-diphosphate reductase beta chain
MQIVFQKRRLVVNLVQDKLLLNVNGDDSKEARQLINGNTTNIMNLNNVKYTWANKLYRVMMENFWIPEKNNITSDKGTYPLLTEDEKTAYDGTLSFLIFLDSMQTANVPNISSVITAPEVNLILSIQTYQEAVHSQSYQYIIESILPPEKRDYLYDLWRDNPILLKRVQYIAQVFQDYLDNKTEQNFKRVLVANYLLEGLYFYNGFQFFYGLANRGLMNGTAEIVKLINRDELTHVIIFEHLIKEICDVNGADKEWIQDMFSVAVEQEVTWSNHILGNNILGISEASTEQYTKHLANRRAKAIRLPLPYPEVTHNPYKHLEEIADVGGEGSSKGNFFEGNNTAYNQSSAVSGFDDF